MPHAPGTPVRLETTRLVIRSMTGGDVTPDVASWFSDPDTTRHLFRPVEQRSRPPEAVARAFVASADNQTRFLLGLFLKETGKAIGYLRFTFDPRNRIVVPTLVIGEKRYRAQLLNDEAFGAVTQFAFEELGANKLMVAAYPENELTVKLLTRGGYRQEAHLREHEWDGTRFRDVLQFSLLASEWRKLTGR